MRYHDFLDTIPNRLQAVVGTGMSHLTGAGQQEHFLTLKFLRQFVRLGGSVTVKSGKIVLDTTSLLSKLDVTVIQLLLDGTSSLDSAFITHPDDLDADEFEDISLETQAPSVEIELDTDEYDEDIILMRPPLRRSHEHENMFETGKYTKQTF